MAKKVYRIERVSEAYLTWLKERAEDGVTRQGCARSGQSAEWCGQPIVFRCTTETQYNGKRGLEAQITHLCFDHGVEFAKEHHCVGVAEAFAPPKSPRIEVVK